MTENAFQKKMNGLFFKKRKRFRKTRTHSNFVRTLFFCLKKGHSFFLERVFCREHFLLGQNPNILSIERDF
jgi:hypothetical protein